MNLSTAMTAAVPWQTSSGALHHLASASGTPSVVRAKRGHPVYRRLQAPLDNGYEEAVVPVAFQFGEMSDDWPQVTAVVASAPTLGVERTVSRLRRALVTSGTAAEEVLRHLAVLEPDRLRDIGRMRVTVCDRHEAWQAPRPAANVACAYLGILRAEDETTPIGYCAFRLEWLAAAAARGSGDVKLTVGVESLWVSADRRGQSLETLLRAAMCDAAWRSVRHIDRTAPWTPNRRGAACVEFAAVDGRVGPDDAFIEDCADHFCDWLETFDSELRHIDVQRIAARAASC